MKVDMTYWCESCARKNNCYTIRSRPKCFTPITSNDRTADCKTEPTISKMEQVEPQTVETMGEDVPMEYFENGGTWTDCAWRRGDV